MIFALRTLLAKLKMKQSKCSYNTVKMSVEFQVNTEKYMKSRQVTGLSSPC